MAGRPFRFLLEPDTREISFLIKMETPKKILVIQLKRIGDIVLTLPAVEALRRAFPAAKIDFLAEHPGSQILEGHPCLDKVLRYEPKRPLRWILKVRRENYDWVIDFLGNPRSAIVTAFSGAKVRAGPGYVFHRWAYNRKFPKPSQTLYVASEKIRHLENLGIEAPKELPFRLSVEPARKDWAARVLKESFWIGFFPNSFKVTRQWPAEHFIGLGRKLTEETGASILVFWGPGEKENALKIARGIGPKAAAGPETGHLKDLAALIERCRFVVTNCNGPKHIAVALGVPTLTIHSSSDPRAWNPAPEGSERFQYIRREELWCIGCMKNKCPYELQCLTLLSPQRVYEKAKMMLENLGIAEPKSLQPGNPK